jgi:hypothetical protein
MSKVWQALLCILLGKDAGSDVLAGLYASFGNPAYFEKLTDGFGNFREDFVLSAIRYLQEIIPIREGLIHRIEHDDQGFSRSQSPMDTADLVAS